MNIFEAAKLLDGCEYREEPESIFKEMKANGLVAVFGASDDLMDIAGAINDETGAPGVVYFDGAGLLTNSCHDEYCPYFEREKDNAKTIEAIWCPEGKDMSFAY